MIPNEGQVWKRRVWRGVRIQDAASASETSWEGDDPAGPSGTRLGLQGPWRQDLRAAMARPFEVNIEEGMDVVGCDGEASTRFQMAEDAGGHKRGDDETALQQDLITEGEVIRAMNRDQVSTRQAQVD